MLVEVVISSTGKYLSFWSVLLFKMSPRLVKFQFVLEDSKGQKYGLELAFKQAAFLFRIDTLPTTSTVINLVPS